MEVGTEQDPYSSKLFITLHGNQDDKRIDLFGNKVLGVKDGILEMHGLKRSVTWTKLAQTAMPGDLHVKLTQKVDWKAGEYIVVASTSFSNSENELRKIISVSKDSLTLFLDKALAHLHLSETYSNDGNELMMQAEIGLLSRNVVFRGDKSSSGKNYGYGAHLMLHSVESPSRVQGRFSNVEFDDMG